MSKRTRDSSEEYSSEKKTVYKKTNPFKNHEDRICLDKAKYNSKCCKCNHMIRKGIDNVRLGNSDKWEHDYCNSELFEG